MKEGVNDGYLISFYEIDTCLPELRRCVNESRGGRPGLLVPNSPRGLRGRKATLKSNLPTSGWGFEITDVGCVVLCFSFSQIVCVFFLFF